MCIGSQVAPALGEIFLGKVDRILEGTMKTGIVKIFRFVDNYLVITRSHNWSGEANQDGFYLSRRWTGFGIHLRVAF